MEPTDITIEILKDIRNEIHETRHELSRRIVETEIRTSTAITELAGTVHELTDVPRASHDLRPRLERCERDIGELKRRMPQGDVRVGTLDEPDRLPPDIHIFTMSKQPWVVLPPGAHAVREYYDRNDLWPKESLERRAALEL